MQMDVSSPCHADSVPMSWLVLRQILLRGQALVLICGSFKTALANAIKNLPERESLVMSLYYDEDLNLREIGEILGVSESRVCQIHRQALMRLKARLSDRTAEEPE